LILSGHLGPADFISGRGTLEIEALKPRAHASASHSCRVFSIGVQEWPSFSVPRYKGPLMPGLLSAYIFLSDNVLVGLREGAMFRPKNSHRLGPREGAMFRPKNSHPPVEFRKIFPEDAGLSGSMSEQRRVVWQGAIIGVAWVFVLPIYNTSDPYVFLQAFAGDAIGSTVMCSVTYVLVRHFSVSIKQDINAGGGLRATRARFRTAFKTDFSLMMVSGFSLSLSTLHARVRPKLLSGLPLSRKRCLTCVTIPIPAVCGDLLVLVSGLGSWQCR
jgi:hypothetical protein